MITDMEVLIGELEIAPRASDDLDRRVIRALGWELRSEEIYDVWHSEDGQKYREPDLPAFSRDLGAAWELLPENVGLTLHRFLGLKGRSWATIHTNYPEGTPRPAGTLARPEWTCSANTEALAVCAAVLRMRMEQQTEMLLQQT